MDAVEGPQDLRQRDALIEQYQGYVRATVRKLIAYLGLPANRFDDFVSAGYLGLVEAAGRFDQRTNDSFQNYAFLRIRGAVIDSIRRESDLKGVAYKRARAVAAAHEIRMEEFNSAVKQKPASQKRSASHDLERVLDLASKTALTHRLSFSDAEDELNESENAAPTPEQAFEKKEGEERIQQLLATLPEKERLVLENFYFKDMSFTDIAQHHAGLSKSWVSRIHDNGLSKLKALLLKPRLLKPAETTSTPLVVKKTVRSGRPPAVERRLSGANLNKSSRKRSKPRPRTIRGGRLSDPKNSPA